jgi:hypothetical protein
MSQLAFQLSPALVVELVDRLARVTFDNARHKARLVCSYRGQVIDTAISPRILGRIDGSWNWLAVENDFKGVEALARYDARLSVGGLLGRDTDV